MELHPVFFELHSQLKQEGPGSDTSTKRALEMLPSLPEQIAVLDIGCGPGRQTLFLARNLKGSIMALDSHPPYIEQLNQSFDRESFKSKIQTICRPMDASNFKDHQFDLIWSEGTLYALGVEPTLNSCRRILKTPGYIAFTELTLFTHDPKSKASQFWKSAYPEVKSIDENLEMISKIGYSILGHFKLPPSDWQEYYRPLSERIEMLRKKYSDDPAALEALQEDANEMELYSQHGDDFGYVFYLLSND